jgi:pimeloyl-ACP methyl ester carboxylesterase/DNA-binding CsgD family transcriptional regulator
LKQQIRFCRSSDGTRLAYAITGEGPPLVKAPHWLTHLEYEVKSPLLGPWIRALSNGRTLLRMDERACGLSDWDAGDLSFDAWVRDLEAVVEAAGFERFALLGHSQGASIAIDYARRHPERVTHLVLLGGYVRGWLKRGLPPERVAELQAQLKLIEVGWGRDDPAYRHMFSTQFAPGATLEQMSSLSELQRVSASPENALRLIRGFFDIDVREQAPHVMCPTLVLHGRGDLRAPFEEGRITASLIPGARLVPLDTANHILLEHEPAFQHFFEELDSFVPRRRSTVATPFDELTVREAEILERIAQGLDNAQIAAHLGLSEKTVRNHITHIFDKIGVENRSQAIVLARERGLGQQSRSS